MPRPDRQSALPAGLIVAGLALCAGSAGCAEMATANAGLAAANLVVATAYAISDVAHEATQFREPTPAEKVERAREILGRMARGQTTMERLSDGDKVLLAEMATIVRNKKAERRGEN